MVVEKRGSSKKFRSEIGLLQRYKNMRKPLIYIYYMRVQSSLTAPSEPLDNKQDTCTEGALSVLMLQNGA
jgi:hypothetical protein